MKKFSLLILLLLGSTTFLIAQCTEEIILASQAEVDAFPTYNCGTIEGDLKIQGTDITNVDSLIYLTEIQGLLRIFNTDLISLSGLENLSMAETITIEANNELLDIAGLSNVANSGDNNNEFKILKNDGIVSITDLPYWNGKHLISENEALQEISLTLSNIHSFGVYENPNLTSISFNGDLSLNSGLSIRDNANLETVNFSSIFVAGSINISDNENLETINFSSLVLSGGALGISNNNNLTSFFCAESNILSINTNGTINIIWNPKLEDITIDMPSANFEKIRIGWNDILSNLGNIAISEVDELIIIHNPLLESIENLVITGYIASAVLISNPLLEACCSFPFELVENDINLDNNAPGCSSTEEIIDNCDNLSLCDFEINITLSSQTEVDAFFTYNCETIQGNLTIDGENITNLDSLIYLTEIEDKLTIQNTNLTNLDGLENLNTVAMFAIKNNANLLNIDALANIENSGNFYGDFEIINNDALISIPGFANWIGNADVSDNDALQEISLMSPVFYDFRIDNNSSLNSVHFNSNIRIDGTFSIFNNENLATIAIDSIHLSQGKLRIHNNLNLESISCIGQTYNGEHIKIYDNPQLENITMDITRKIELVEIYNNNTLSNLGNITLEEVQNLEIKNNAILENIEGLVIETYLGNLEITDNPLLQECCALPLNFNYINLFNNATGCNSTQEIMAHCDDLDICDFTQEIIIDSQAGIDTFSTAYPCETILGDLIIEGEDITNLDGLSNLTAIVGNLYIESNPLLNNLEGLSGITMIGDSLLIEYNSLLNNLEGLSNLTTVGGSLFIEHNPLLNNLDALSNLTTIGRSLSVSSCQNLVNIDGLINLTTVQSLFIVDNENLSNCCSVPCWIDAVQDYIAIDSNANGCNHLSDIEESCEGEIDCGLVANVNLNVLLEGAYTENSGLMKTTLQDLNLLPLSQPYNVAPYDYEGLESVATAADLPVNIVDWVLVEARGGTPDLMEASTMMIEANAGFLLANGSVVGMDGNAIVFRNLEYGVPYHFVIRHQNHLDIISKEAVVASDQMAYDFTTSIDQAFGTTQQKILSNGKAALYVGDYTQDGVLQITDYDVWQDNPAQNNVYSITDGTLDGVVQNTDADAWRLNKAKIGVVEIRF